MRPTGSLLALVGSGTLKTCRHRLLDQTLDGSTWATDTNSLSCHGKSSHARESLHAADHAATDLPVGRPRSRRLREDPRRHGAACCGARTRSRVLDGFGGFASLFSLDYNTRLFARNYQHPVLVACTDGVGSKLKVAALAGKHDTVGIDLVAMSVNDCLCTGGEPLFFLDYLAMPKDDPALTQALLKGISDGCLEADCALVGGETAILPDFYAAGRLRHGRLLRRRRRARSHHQRPRHPPRRRGARPGVAAAFTPTATAWCARSSSSTPG